MATRFHKLFGGLEVGGNGYVKNLVVEQLDKDPAVNTAGRVWFNTSDEVFRCSVTETTTDDDGNETTSIVIKTIGAAEDMRAFITDLASTDADKGAALVGFVGESGANGKYSVDAADGQTVLKSLVDAIDADRKTIDDNAASASNDTKAVQDELDKTQVGAGLNDDGTYAANSDANYISGAASLNDADNKLDAALKAQADKEDKDIQDTKAYVDDNYLSTTKTDPQNVASAVTFGDDVVVNGNFTVSTGKVTEIETEQLKVSDNIITLNSDVADDAAPSENAGVEINRGKEGVMPLLIWDENDDTPKVVNGKDSDGNYVLAPIATGGDADEIQKELDDTQTGAGLADDGSYTANSDATYIKDATSLADADNKLDASLKDQADKEAKDVSDLNTRADNIQAELDNAEKGAGLADDGSYVANTNANYISGATSLNDADNKLDSSLKNVEDKANSNTTEIGNLKGELNATRFVYESTDAATSYTIAHNLGSQMIDVMIWVYDEDDSKWYNDSVVVSVVDDNNIQVDLTSAAKIRATITDVSHQF